MATTWTNPIDTKFIDQSFQLAEEALDAGEVPVGCVIVLDKTPIDDQQSIIEVIARARNEVNATKNATRHAELVAIDRALEKFVDDDRGDTASIFRRCTIYVTVEPCILCADALLRIGIGRVVFCCRNERFGGLGSVLDVRRTGDESMVEVIKIDDQRFQQRAIDLLQRFYQGENPNAPEPKVKTRKKKESI